MDRSVLFQAHHLPLVILDKLFAMSKGFLLLIFELLLVGMALFSEQAGTTYIDRTTRGDMFRNSPRNTSSDCHAKGAMCTIGGAAGDKICEKNCCFCRCKNDKPTFLIQERRCVKEPELLRILQNQGHKQECNYRSIVAASSQAMPTCKQKVLIAIDTTRGATNHSMKFCAWSSASDLIHELVAKGIKSCSIVPSNSFYLFNGTWFPMWAPEAASSQEVFNVHVEGNNASVADILLEWNKDLPSEYAGLIVSLKLRCQKNDGDIKTSCLFSKNRGVFNGSKPTFYPPSTRILSSTTATIRLKTATSAIGTEPMTSNVPGLRRNRGEKVELNVLVLVLATVGAILIVLLCVSLLLLILRRRNRDIAEKFQPRGNPVYQKGPSTSLKVKDGDRKQSLPFIINDESHDQHNGAVPLRSKTQEPSQGSSKDPLAQGPSSSEPDLYQCLIEEDVEGRDYQVLLDDGQLEELQEAEDEHEYHVLESDGASSNSDSYSVEMPPVQNTKHVSARESNLLDDLLDDIHDYDEPDDIYESKGPGNRFIRDTNIIRGGDKKINDVENGRLSGYDEPGTILSEDDECDQATTLRSYEKPGIPSDQCEFTSQAIKEQMAAMAST